jgi:hypothetical protein
MIRARILIPGSYHTGFNLYRPHCRKRIGFLRSPAKRSEDTRIIPMKRPMATPLPDGNHVNRVSVNGIVMNTIEQIVHNPSQKVTPFRKTISLVI